MQEIKIPIKGKIKRVVVKKLLIEFDMFVQADGFKPLLSNESVEVDVDIPITSIVD